MLSTPIGVLAHTMQASFQASIQGTRSRWNEDPDGKGNLKSLLCPCTWQLHVSLCILPTKGESLVSFRPADSPTLCSAMSGNDRLSVCLSAHLTANMRRLKRRREMNERPIRYSSRLPARLCSSIFGVRLSKRSRDLEKGYISGTSI